MDLDPPIQYALLGVSRSLRYYKPAGVSAGNLTLMRRMYELYLKYPYYGSRQMARYLRREGMWTPFASTTSFDEGAFKQLNSPLKGSPDVQRTTIT